MLWRWIKPQAPDFTFFNGLNSEKKIRTEMRGMKFPEKEKKRWERRLKQSGNAIEGELKGERNAQL